MKSRGHKIKLTDLNRTNRQENRAKEKVQKTTIYRHTHIHTSAHTF